MEAVPEDLRIKVEEAVAPARAAWRAAERVAGLREVPGKLRAWWVAADALQKEIVASVVVTVFLGAFAIGVELAKRRINATEEASGGTEAPDSTPEPEPAA